METREKEKPVLRVIVIFLLCVLVIGGALSVKNNMEKMKKPPAQAKYKERPIKVETVIARAENQMVVIRGFGEARPLDTVPVAPEISGSIVNIHPNLEPGQVIPKGETLFEIDPRNYKAAYNEAKARVDQTRSIVERLKKEYKIERARIKTLMRNKELAKADFDRVKRLYVKNRIGTRTSLDKSEQAYNSATDLADQLSRQIDIYPIRILENQAIHESALATLSKARANLDRCNIKALFTGRVKEVDVETGQYVLPGQKALVLADDSILEILVPVDSRDAKKWLKFNGKNAGNSAAWFSGLEQVGCRVFWTEDREGKGWTGWLHRVVKFDPKTRTLTVAVRVAAAEANKNDGLPLVEGMFCTVEIPGNLLADVVKLPRWAVSFQNTVYISDKNRLKTVSVKVARIEGNFAFVAEGIENGDHVIITRLVDPLENTLLELMGPQPENKAGDKKGKEL